MIEAITYENIIKYLGKFLDANSGMIPQRIFNADSIRGTDLAEMISDTESYSPIANPGFMLFELLEDPDNEDNYITKGENERDMMTIQTYDFHMMIYGNTSPTIAQRISAIFKEEKNVLDLRDLGIYIKGVYPIEAINEFINNTLMLRRDLRVKIECRFNFAEISEEPEYFDSAQNITLITRKV